MIQNFINDYDYAHNNKVRKDVVDEPIDQVLFNDDELVTDNQTNIAIKEDECNEQ